MSRIVVLPAILLGLACPSSEPEPQAGAKTEAKPPTDKGTKMNLTSTAFKDGQPIPTEYTCESADRSPPLSWSGTPSGTKSLALVVDDPDAPDPAKPETVFVHWVVFNIPPDVTELAAAASLSLPRGAQAGKNDLGKTAWGGPCPPIGRHRYFHKLYALDTTLDLEEPSKADLLDAMKGHVLGEAELVGTYEKQRRDMPATP